MSNEVITHKHKWVRGLFSELDRIAKDAATMADENQPLLGGEHYLTDRELSERLKISRRTLQDYRNNGILPYRQLGGKILYRESDIEQVAVSVADRSIIQNRIDSDTALLKRIVKDLENSEVTYSAHDIVKRYKSPECHVSVLDFMQNQIRLMRNANRLGTALNYEKTMKNFAEFLGGVNLPFSAMTEQLIADYNAFLVQRGMVRNSISFYMRIMRAVYNKAVRQKLVEQSHPFTEVYTGIDRTRKRAVSESVISQLYKLKLTEGTPLALARDIFIFSYCTRGMAFVDIAYLKKENIQNGVICYARRKTRQLLSVRIEPSIQRIIDRYSSALSPYVFPILTSTETKQAYEEYQAAINKHNRLLRRLSKLLPAGCKLTSYTSRHNDLSYSLKMNRLQN